MIQSATQDIGNSILARVQELYAGTPIQFETMSIGNLAEQATKILRTRPELPVYVRGDTAIAYGRVIEVMTVLQNAGVRDVGLVTDPAELTGGGG